jgi:diguanylate cyclase (GGDEF)-like protein/PAS domain S-box-containing protein
MEDRDKTKEQLTEELTQLRRRVADLEATVRQRQIAEPARKQRYRTLFEESRDAICITARDGKLVDANQSFLDLFGYSRGEMTELRLGQLYVDASAPHRFQAEIEEKGAVRGYEVKLRRKDGTEMDCLFTSTLRRGADGAIMGYQGIICDVTAEKRAEIALRESEEKYRSLVQNLTDGLAIVQGPEIKFLNRALLDLLGCRSEDEVVGRPFTDFVSAEHRSMMMERALARERGEEAPTRYEFRALRKDGTGFDAEISVNRITYEGRPARQGLVRDITAQKKMMEALHKEREKFQLLVEESPLGVALIRKDGRYEYVNPQFVKLFGYELEDIPTGREWFAKAYPDPEKRGRAVRTWLADLKESKRGHTRVRTFSVTCSDGSQKVIHFRALTMDSGDQFVTYEDVTERKRTEDAMKQLAYHDVLTGLPNRALFNDRLGVALAHARRNHLSVAVMLLDLDHFKDVNDTLGHPVGDLLLQAVGERLTSLLRETDTVCRIGGDEFLVLLPAITRGNDGTKVADRLLGAIREPFHVGDAELRITTSLGIAMYPEDGDDADTLTRNADIAMYRAKQMGRDNYQRSNAGLEPEGALCFMGETQHDRRG